MKSWWSNIFYSFPFQLIILHLRSNHLLLSIWVLMGLLISGRIGRKLGIQYLFLGPEYLGTINFWSFFSLGLAFGGFVMTWNLTTYLLSSQHFPFLASLSRPFTKFSLNNFVFPFGFFLFYLTLIIHFQHFYEGWNFETIFLNGFGFLTGTLTLVLLYSLYFHYTNRDISYYIRRAQVPPNLVKNIAPGRRNVDVEYIKLDQNRWKVKTYLNESFRPRIIRSVAHYDSSLLLSIFKQNHLNALIIQLFGMIFILALGYMIDIPSFQIPSAGSVFILMSLLVAIIGAITYWFHEWRVIIMILMLIALNFFTSFKNFHHSNKAYGLDYTTQPATYSYEEMLRLISPENIDADKANTIEVLNNWKKRIGKKKPKMVVISASGGGLKSAIWTMQVIRKADSLLNGALLKHTVLITGASGGMLGTAYLRELYLQKQQGYAINLLDDRYIDNISKDLLNPIAFTMVTNDLFLPWASFKVGGTYLSKR